MSFPFPSQHFACTGHRLGSAVGSNGGCCLSRSLSLHPPEVACGGSGAVGRACLRLDIQYLAAPATEAHASWLSNVLDREACQLIVKNKSPLFEPDLAEQIQAHFSDVLEQMREQSDAVDSEPAEPLDGLE